MVVMANGVVTLGAPALDGDIIIKLIGHFFGPSYVFDQIVGAVLQSQLPGCVINDAKSKKGHGQKHRQKNETFQFAHQRPIEQGSKRRSFFPGGRGSVFLRHLDICPGDRLDQRDHYKYSGSGRFDGIGFLQPQLFDHSGPHGKFLNFAGNGHGKFGNKTNVSRHLKMRYAFVQKGGQVLRRGLHA